MFSLKTISSEIDLLRPVHKLTWRPFSLSSYALVSLLHIICHTIAVKFRAKWLKLTSHALRWLDCFRWNLSPSNKSTIDYYTIYLWQVYVWLDAEMVIAQMCYIGLFPWFMKFSSLIFTFVVYGATGLTFSESFRGNYFIIYHFLDIPMKLNTLILTQMSVWNSSGHFSCYRIKEFWEI